MKVYNIIKQAILILSVVLLAVSGIIGSAESVGTETVVEGTTPVSAVGAVVATLVVTWIGCALIGLFLLYTKNDVARKLGYAFITTAFTVCMISLLAQTFKGTAIVLMLVAIVLYALYYIVWFVGSLAIKGRGGNVEDPDDDPRIQKLKKWKALEQDGMITSAEFEEKRVEILGLTKKEK